MYSESVSINLSVRADFRFGRIDYCDEFCYNTYISIKFGFDQKQFNRSLTASFAFSQMALFLLYRKFRPFEAQKETYVHRTYVR